jgi:hypothetical protein
MLWETLFRKVNVQAGEGSMAAPVVVVVWKIWISPMRHNHHARHTHIAV